MSAPAPDPTDIMRTRLQADLRLAMKRRDGVETGVLRCLIAALDNAGAIVVTPPVGPATFAGSEHVATGLAWGSAEAVRRALSAEEVDAVIEGETAARRDAADEFDLRGRPAEAGQARAEAAIAARYRAPGED